MTALFKLVDQYRSLQQIDIEDIDETTLLDTLEALGGELQVKATNVALYQQNVQALADAIKDASKKMADRAKRVQAKADSIRAHLQSCMEAAQITKIDGPELTLAIKKNPPALVIAPDAVIPERYMVTPPAPAPYPDKTAIKAAINGGEQIEGCRLEQGQRLDIRI